MKQFTKKETRYLLKNEDRYTIAYFAKYFKCTPKEVYNYYNRITKTEEYRDFVETRIQFMRKERRFGRDKVGDTNESGENREGSLKGLPQIYHNTTTGDSIAYSFWGGTHKSSS